MASKQTSVAAVEVYKITAAQSVLLTSPVSSTALQIEYNIALEDYNLTYMSAIFPYIN